VVEPHEVYSWEDVSDVVGSERKISFLEVIRVRRKRKWL
jgi:hypothetical protein